MKRALFMAVVVMVAAGCVGVPANRIPTPNGPVKIPQDHTFDSLFYFRSNNVVVLEITGLRSKNNPVTVQATGEAEEKKIRAIGDVAEKFLEKGMKAKGL
jgi:hypothetical protein